MALIMAIPNKDKYRDTSRKNAHVCNMNILILITVFRSYDQLQFLRKKSRVNTRLKFSKSKARSKSKGKKMLIPTERSCH